jgi:hypothetical protein
MSSHAKQKGDLKRDVICNFCGQSHRRKSKEARECRRRARSGQQPPSAPGPLAAPSTARKGSEVTRYTTDPLGGDKQAHAVARQLRGGVPSRTIAKRMGLPLRRVLDIVHQLNQSGKTDAG